MKIMVIGSGLMGPAAAYNAMCDPHVSQVMLCDKSQSQLALAEEKLADKRGAEKLGTAVLDLSDQATAVQLISGFDAVVAALPESAIGLGIRAAIAAKVPWLI